jgi:hypothetical protein
MQRKRAPLRRREAARRICTRYDAGARDTPRVVAFNLR